MRLPRPLRAVVTAGGTEEAIDDVRTLSNVSSGRFGAAIARALDRRGVATTLIASRALASRGEELRGRIEVVPFRGFADLDRLLAALEADPPDLLFMAAAVSDFAPAPASGKIPSDAASLDLHLTRNPKLLARLRSALGERTVLVGFKLLSHVGPGELERVARGQARSAGLDLTVANDLVELVGDRHPVLLVPPHGDVARIDAHREDTADAVVAAAIAIADARGALAAGPGTRAVERGPGADAGGAHAAARDGGAADRAEGVADRGEGGASLAAAIRDVADRLGFAEDARALRVRGDGGRSLLLDTVAGVDAILAVDEALGRFDATLAADEATSDEALRAALAEAAAAGRWNGGPFALGIEGGGAVLGLDRRAAAGLAAGLAEAVAELESSHAALDDRMRRAARPILDGARVAGVALADERGVIVPFVTPRARGRGVGDQLARDLAARAVGVAVPEADVGFFVERGFRRAGDDGSRASGPVRLLPPDPALAIPAVSVALVDPLRRRVLLGRRTAAPYERWWAFPGGKLAAGEDVRAAAARELAEETGITLPAALRPRLAAQVLAGDGARVFAIECLAFLVLDAPTPRATDEMDARWVSLASAASLRPMTAGTRLVLRRLQALVR